MKPYLMFRTVAALAAFCFLTSCSSLDEEENKDKKEDRFSFLRSEEAKKKSDSASRE